MKEEKDENIVGGEDGEMEEGSGDRKTDLRGNTEGGRNDSRQEKRTQQQRGEEEG
jgi:hypothetical protein